MTTTFPDPGPPLTPHELGARGFAALLRELGRVDYARFIQQFVPGRGDYTRDRDQWLDGLTLEQVTQLIAERRRQS